MRDTDFDAFGERFFAGADRAERAPGRASQLAMRAGVGLFWSLVVVIVAARVATFNPDLAHSFGAVAANCLRIVGLG